MIEASHTTVLCFLSYRLPLYPPKKQMPPLPPPPPRRVAPVPPPVGEVIADLEDSYTPLSVAARIANFRHPQLPPAYRKDESSSTSEIGLSASITIKAPSRAFALVIAGLDPAYLSQLLARPPPPVPVNNLCQGPGGEIDYDPPPQLPPRRLPPKLSSPAYPDHDHNTPDKKGILASEIYYDHHTQREEDTYQDDEANNNISTTTQTSAPREEPSSSGLFPEGTCIKCYDFSYVDAHASQFPRQYVASLDELADNLTEPFTYETEKARAIFTWMHHNIQYDTQSFFAGNVKPATPGSVLSSGLAVCDGYAGLFVYLAERAGLQVYKVSGHGKGFGYQELAPGEPVPNISHNHAWNCLLMDGEWRLIDATWGAGALNGSTYEQRFDPSWFSSSPSEFVKRHFPSDPTFQLLSDEEGGPIGWEEYIMRPPGPVIFTDFHRLDLHVDFVQPASDVIRRGQTVTFTLFKRCEHMSNHDVDTSVYILLLPNRKPIRLEPNAEGGWSLTYKILDQLTEVSLLFVSTVDGQDAKGIGMRGFNNAVDRKPMTFGGLVKWRVG